MDAFCFVFGTKGAAVELKNIVPQQLVKMELIMTV